MEGYLGETVVEQKDTEYKDYTEKDWALYFITVYGGFDGAHHKDWVIDQVARILKGTPVIIEEVKWENDGETHTDYRVSTGEPSKEYQKWVADLCDGEDGPNTYSYDCGVAP